MAVVVVAVVVVVAIASSPLLSSPCSLSHYLVTGSQDGSVLVYDAWDALQKVCRVGQILVLCDWFNCYVNLIYWDILF